MVAAEPPSQRAQHPSEAMQPKQPATFARIPHAAIIEHMESNSVGRCTVIQRPNRHGPARSGIGGGASPVTG